MAYGGQRFESAWLHQGLASCKYYSERKCLVINCILDYKYVQIFLYADEILLNKFLEKYEDITIYTKSHRSNSKKALHLSHTPIRENHRYQLVRSTLLYIVIIIL